MNTGAKILTWSVILGIGGYVIYRKFNGRMISKKGLSFLTQLEGFRTKAYKDAVGLWTTGVGHLIKPEEQSLISKVLTKPEVEKLLNKDLDRFEKTVTDTIKVPLTKNQKDALVSLAFNIGQTGFKNSTLAKYINAKASPEAIIKAFSAWNNPAVLKERRAKEARLFLTGNYSTLIDDNDFHTYYKGA